jgi:hypothetical protein
MRYAASMAGTRVPPLARVLEPSTLLEDCSHSLAGIPGPVSLALNATWPLAAANCDVRLAILASKLQRLTSASCDHMLGVLRNAPKLLCPAMIVPWAKVHPGAQPFGG